MQREPCAPCVNPTMSLKRGAFIVFEGVDRCGKTTQTKRLYEYLQLQGIPAELMRFPDRTTSTGKIIDSYLTNGVDLDDRAIHLLFSANRWEASNRIKRKLEEGITLIVDRYAYSGVCFTGAKPNQTVDWCKAPDVGLPEPDAVFFLDLPVELSMRRGNFGEERYEKEGFQRKVYENFKAMIDPQTWKVIDASQSIEAVSEAIQPAVLEVIKAVEDAPIGELWTEK